MRESIFRCFFYFMLTFLSWRIGSQLGKRPQALSLVEGKEELVLFKTKDEKCSKLFHFSQNRFSNDGGVGTPTLCVEFASAETAVKLLMRTDINAFLAAIQNKDVFVTGNYPVLMWFMSVVKCVIRKAKK